jgi:hypothetical protein
MRGTDADIVILSRLMSDDKSSVFGGNYASAGDSFQITSEFFLSLFELFAEVINFLTEEGGAQEVPAIRRALPENPALRTVDDVITV